jgi:superfamily II DNA or RNA helicase
VGVITGETPADERLFQLHGFPIVAVTAGVGQENYNRTDLDTLVFLTAPKAYAHAAPLVQQAVGRIQREKEGKKPPQVWLLRAVGVPESVVHVGTILRWAKAQGYRVFRPTPIKAAIKAAEAARGA